MPEHVQSWPLARWGKRALLAIIVPILLAGCGFDDFFAAQPEVPLELDYNRVLPEGWRPITRWYEVNIDSDEDTEYLLLFTYDSGQVGAVIYDQQVSTDLVAAGESAAAREGQLPGPLQAFGYYRPYLLLPSNWDYTYGGEVSHGFVAHPSDANNITVTQVARAQNLADVLGMGNFFGENRSHPHAELVIQGGATHLTFVWWKNRQEGYGVTQLFAPGGFRGIDWDTWRDAPQPIDEIAGLYPLTDYRARSLLCRETAFQRVGLEALVGDETELGASDGEGTPTDTIPDLAPAAGTPSIAFSARDQGIHFCTDAPPAHPFYPEGVVLAYLWHARQESQAGNPSAARAQLATSGSGLGFLDDALNLAALAGERVNDIESFATVPVTAAVHQEGEFAPTTSVCVELAEADNPARRRWLLFTLRYHAPDMEARTPDRWTISGIAHHPSPISGTPDGHCRTVLGLE